MNQIFITSYLIVLRDLPEEITNHSMLSERAIDMPEKFQPHSNHQWKSLSDMAESLDGIALSKIF
jgi:hypothetical protein